MCDKITECGAGTMVLQNNSMPRGILSIIEAQQHISLQIFQITWLRKISRDYFLSGGGSLMSSFHPKETNLGRGLVLSDFWTFKI